MRFVLLMYRDEEAWEARPEAERVAIRQQAIDHAEGLRARGVFLGGDPLLPTSTAVTVRLAAGTPLATDGPFAETKEQLGGYYLIEAPDLDAAVAWAARCPGAQHGSIEVRQVWTM